MDQNCLLDGKAKFSFDKKSKITNDQGKNRTTRGTSSVRRFISCGFPRLLLFLNHNFYIPVFFLYLKHEYGKIDTEQWQRKFKGVSRDLSQ